MDVVLAEQKDLIREPVDRQSDKESQSMEGL